MTGAPNRREDSFKNSRDEQKAACKRKLSQFYHEKVGFCGDLMISDDSPPAGDNVNKMMIVLRDKENVLPKIRVTNMN